mgnify:CR=1 FL=1
MQSESKKNLIERINAEQSAFSSLYLNFLKKLMNKKFLGIFFSYAILFLVALSIKYTVAFYSDIEKSFDNIFTAGVIDLEVANSDEYLNSQTGKQNSSTTWNFGETIQKFFDFSNLKPGDSGRDEIKLRVKTNPAWVCAKIYNILSLDGIDSEPELIDDQTPGAEGEIDDDAEFIFWNDVNSNNIPDGSEKILWHGKLDSEKAFAIADSKYNLFFDQNNPLEPDTIYRIKKSWCLGTFENGFATCNGRMLNNRTQGDKLTADIAFFAIQSRNNLDFVCETTPQEYKYYNCDKTNNSCPITQNFYKTREECIAQTGGDCFKTNGDCQAVCQPEVKEYFVCNQCANSCASVKTYTSLQECESKELKTCYASKDECDTKCGKPAECATPFSCAPQTKDGFTVSQLSKQKNCDGTYTYKFQVTNNNKNALSHVSFSLPCGITPIWPANGATYQTTNHSYKVENPTNDPNFGQMGIKFETLDTEGIKFGESDIFEFKLNQYVGDIGIVMQTKWATNYTDFVLNCSGMTCSSCNQYYTCDNNCYVCGQTAQSYETLSECQTKTGKICYASNSDCSNYCKAPAIITSTECGSGSSPVLAIARMGNNDFWSSPTEILIKKNGVEADGKNHEWNALRWYDFTLEYASGVVKFNVKSYDGTNKTVQTNATLGGSNAQIEIKSPNCGAVRVRTVKYQKTECSNYIKDIGGVEINNNNPACVAGTRYLGFSGLDFSKPFKLTGQFQFEWVDGTSVTDIDIPSMTIKLN